MEKYEERHRSRHHDFSILNKFEFKYAPVGFKYFNLESDVKTLGLKKLDKRIALCQMILEAPAGEAFYAEADNQFCEAGLFLTGHSELNPLAAGGRIGPAFDVYPDERVNRRAYNHISCLAVGSVHSTGFASLDKMIFDPDLLILICDNMDQAERILRATQYDTGDPVESRITYVIGCNWIFNYRYVSGKINMVFTGISYSMKMYKLYPPGIPIISIPWHHIDRVLTNMKEMPWTVPGHTDKKEEFYKIAHARLGVKQII